MRIYGASDDLLEIECDNGDDQDQEIGCYDKTVWVRIGEESEGLLVLAEYAPGETACWRLAVEPIDDGVPCPWPMRMEIKNYTPVLIIDCPKGTPFVFGTGVADMDAARKERERIAAIKRVRDAELAAEAKEREEYQRLYKKFGGSK